MRVGIYICECGPNVKEAVDIGAVMTFASGLENVVLAKSLNILCSDEGKNLIE